MMKIRMNERSVRLRLLRSEVARFRSTGEVTASIQFPGRELRYRLRRGECAQPTVSFAGDALDVVVPAGEGDVWSTGSQVGIYGKSDGIDILVEKDFRRTSAPSPDDDDRYPNPRSSRPGVGETA
jgi:hypothetical protein